MSTRDDNLIIIIAIIELTNNANIDPKKNTKHQVKHLTPIHQWKDMNEKSKLWRLNFSFSFFWFGHFGLFSWLRLCKHKHTRTVRKSKSDIHYIDTQGDNRKRKESIWINEKLKIFQKREFKKKERKINVSVFNIQCCKKLSFHLSKKREINLPIVFSV